MKRILVPLDGSDFAERALSPAVALATRHGAEIHLHSVVSNVPIVPVSFADPILLPDWLDQDEARLQGYVEQTAAKVAARSGELRVEAGVSVGRVGETIRKVADELDVDLVVLTGTGPAGLARKYGGRADSHAGTTAPSPSADSGRRATLRRRPDPPPDGSAGRV